MLEVVILNVRPGQSRAFEDAFREAQEIISASRGYQRHELRRCVEVADRYLLLVWWDSLESHTEGFRGSAEYQRWSELLHDFYDPFPTVEHYEPVPEAPDVDTSFGELGKRASSGDPEARARILSLGKSTLPAVQPGLTHPDWKLRRSATLCLAWTQPPDARIRDFLTTLLESETDKKIRKHAEGGAARLGARSRLSCVGAEQRIRFEATRAKLSPE